MHPRTVLALSFVVIAMGCGSAEGPRASILTKLAGDGQEGFPGDTLGQFVRVRVTTLQGSPVPGVTIVFTGVDARTVADSVVSDAAGEASAAVVLGDFSQVASVTAIIKGTTDSAARVPFQFLVKSRCDYPASMTIGDTIAGTLAPHDCYFSGGFNADVYGFSYQALQRARFNLTALFNTYMEIADTSGVIAIAGGTKTTKLNFLARAGRYSLAASSFEAHQAGGYVLATAPESTQHTGNCTLTWATGGVAGVQVLGWTPCEQPDSSSFPSDYYAVVVPAGGRITATMHADSDRAWVMLYWSGSRPDASSLVSARESTATASVVVPGDGRYAVLVEFRVASGFIYQNIPYVMSITTQGPAGAPPNGVNAFALTAMWSAPPIRNLGRFVPLLR